MYAYLTATPLKLGGRCLGSCILHFVQDTLAQLVSYGMKQATGLLTLAVRLAECSPPKKAATVQDCWCVAFVILLPFWVVPQWER